MESQTSSSPGPTYTGQTSRLGYYEAGRKSRGAKPEETPQFIVHFPRTDPDVIVLVVGKGEEDGSPVLVIVKRAEVKFQGELTDLAARVVVS